MLQKIRVRSLLLGGVFTLLFILLTSRLYWLQVVEASWLSEKAAAMWETERTLPAKRGTIYDKNMEVLAGDTKGYTVVINPKVINQFGLEQEVAEGLSELLDKPEKELYALVTARDGEGNLRVYREVRNEGWKIPEEKANEIRAWKQELTEKHGIKGGATWQGVTLREEPLRFYPKNVLASHVLGYVDKDGDPQMGLELALDELLKGTPGKVQYVRDNKGLKLPDSKPELVQPVDGHSVVLTIDQTIQHYADTAVKKIYEQYKPKSITAVAVDPKTGEVLAMVNYPTFDPNKYWEADMSKDIRNMAIQSRYEPGSTFKIVTLAAAVDQGVFNPNETYESGYIRVGGHNIHDHRRWGWGEITYLEGVLRSSNVAFVKLGYERLGETVLKEYIDRFGFNEKTGIDLPWEVGGFVSFRYPSEIASATYGQGGVLVTPLQQLMAYAAIANGGTLMKPYVVKKVINSTTNEVISETKPTVVRQVVSERVAREVTGYLEQVVSNQEIGTGRRAYIEGYRVAGKTGTANIVVNGEYSQDTWVVSFAGYAPAEDPRIAVIVVADQPDLGGDSNRAGEVTTPIFKEIVSQSLRYMGVKPDNEKASIAAVSVLSSGDTSKTVPNVGGMEAEAAVSELEARGFQAQVIGDGEKVLGQYPVAGEQLAGSPQIYLLTVPQEEAPVPNLKGQSLRDVVQLCALLGLQCEANGAGYVTKQELYEKDGKTTLRVELKPLGEFISGQAEGSEAEAAGDTESEENGENETSENKAEESEAGAETAGD